MEELSLAAHTTKSPAVAGINKIVVGVILTVAG